MLWQVTGAVGVGLVVLAVWYRKRLEKKFGRHNALDEVDIRGKIVLITGGNSGLGLQCAKAMAARGARVIIASRDLNRSRETISDIQREVPEAQITAMELDLGTFKSIREFCKEFQSQYKEISILINNGGVFCPLNKKLKTSEGHEYNFGVNHLGHFLLTNLLLETIKRGAPSRIVNVASTLAEKGKLNFDDLLLENENPETSKVHAYGNSKLANMLFSKELCRRLEESRNFNVKTYALCPGWVKTDLARYMGLRWWNYIVIVPAAFLFMRTPDQGVQTILHCALSNKTATDSGKLYRNCGEWNPNANVTDEDAKILWEKSEKLCFGKERQD